jgi:circadian clock protein KaiC
MGVTTLLVNEVESIMGEFRLSELGISYLADNIIFLRYIETRGELRKAVGVLKQRMSDFQRSLRELEITPDGIKVGAPLTNLRGILSGTPGYLPPPG